MPLLHLNYIAHYCRHLHCCYYFPSHNEYAILLHLAWLNSKKLGFTFFLLYSHKGWTASLVCDSVYSLLDLGWFCFLLSPLYSTVNCTSATSYSCDTTITFSLTAQQWTTSDATATNISFPYLHSTFCIANWPTWSLNATRWSKKFHNDASTHWSKKSFPLKNKNPHGTPLHVLWNPRVPQNPCWKELI